MGKSQYLQIIIRTLLIVINGAIIFYCYTNSYVINTVGFFLLLLFQVFLLIDYQKKMFNDIEKSMDCLLHDDYSNTFSVKKRENSLHNKTALLLEKHRTQNLQKASEQLIFTNIIESLSIGVLILRRDNTHKINIFQINNAFTNFLKIPKFYNWNLLKTKIGGLAELIEEWKELKHTISLNVNNEKETFFFKSSVTQTNNLEYLVISLETIQQLIDKKEKEAW